VSGWAAKRFWKQAMVAERDSGFAVELDGSLVRTPAKAPLILPSRELAEAIAAEWDAQGTLLKPHTMPMTRSANSAIDKVTPQFDEVAALIADYGASDLICYRADRPAALVARQAEVWDPLMTFAAQALQAPLVATTGVVPVAQPPASLQRMRAAVRSMDPFALTGFHDLVALSGSLVIGFAVVRGHAPPGLLWAASRVDEEWQAGQWGRDDEAEAAAALKRTAFLDAVRFHSLARSAK
jgi:chaperone required for assembly of F1-ATPase